MPRKPLDIDDECLVAKTLDTISAERGNLDRSFGLVHEVIQKFGEAALAERLYDATPRERPWEDIADLFGILIWSTGDNGDALMNTMEQWLLEAKDVRRVQVALHLDVCPFLGPSSIPGMMEGVLGDIAAKFPQAADRCRELVESYGRLPRVDNAPLERATAAVYLNGRRTSRLPPRPPNGITLDGGMSE